jgi:cysteine desulfurase family protein (TIGR01976 family)
MTTLSFALARAFARRFTSGDEVVITELDHEANRGPWLTLKDRGVVVREVAVKPDGTLDYDDFATKVTSKTKLVCVGWASNALGTVNDIAKAREIANRAGALLLVDAVHYAPHLVMDVQKLGIDFLICSAYKFYGPHVGILYSRTGLLDELETDRLRTAPQAAPERIETGTLNFAAINGVAAAIEYIASWGEGSSLRDRVVDAMNATAAWEHRLGKRYYDGVKKIPGVHVWGPDFDSQRRAPTVSITIEGHDPEKVAQELGDRGIAVWNGDFYARRVAEKFNLYERGGLLRTGIAMYNTEEEIDRLLEALGEIVS